MNLGNTTCDQLPWRLDSIHKDSLGQDSQPVFTQLTVYLPKLQAASFSSRILWENVIGDQVSQGGCLLTI